MSNFQSLGLDEALLNAITDLGFESPTSIQEKAIPELINGNSDFVGLAQTGTGKTAAFGLPMLQLIDTHNRVPQGLILCPTRELCLQITRDLQSYSKYLGQVNVTAIYGGASIINQLRDLKRGTHIIVATPGRMLDVINRKAVDLSNIAITVLDEADEMLNMGFKEDINKILSNTPEEKHTWLFSATMPNDVRRIAQNYMTDPVEVTIGTKNSGNVNIEHEYYVVKARDKYSALKRIVDYHPEIFGIIFTRTKIESQEIAEHLIRDGYNADALHGDLSQVQRDRVMKRYREGALQLLVATDVAARGIDVSDVTHVINYALPDDVEYYTHRSGRTGRAGKSGISICIINSRELGKIRHIEKIIGKKFEKAEIPTGFDVCEKQLFALIHKVQNVTINEEQISPYMNRIYKEFENLSKEEVILRFASLEFNRFLEYYRNAPDLNASVEKDRGERGSSRSDSRDNEQFARMFINAGSVDDITRGDLLRMICDSSGIRGSQVGRIDMKGVYSFFDVERSVADDVYKHMRDMDFNGRKLRVDHAQDGGKGASSGGGSSRRRSSGGGGNRDRRSRDGEFSGRRREGQGRDRRSSGRR